MTSNSSGNTWVNIDAIARAAKVSPSTVSRVLNGSARVSLEREKAVRKAIAKFNYIPNASARHLAGGRSGLIALLVEESNEEFFYNPFWSQVIQGFSTTISNAGSLPLLLVRPRSGSDNSVFSTLLKGKIDALAVLSWHTSSTNIANNLDPKVPTIVVGELGKSINSSNVDVNNIKGGMLATEHLVSVGCRNILVLTGDLKLQSGRDRLEGYKRALFSAGYKFRKEMIFEGDYTSATARELINKALKMKIAFDGVFAANDLSAISAIEVLKNHGIKVPDEVKIVGFDDLPIAVSNNPSITTIRQPIRELGSEVALSLLATLNGEEVADKLLDVELIIRESTFSRKQN
jgi:DNA-binding LacI/PurR family transcriptional regulator